MFFCRAKNLSNNFLLFIQEVFGFADSTGDQDNICEQTTMLHYLLKSSKRKSLLSQNKKLTTSYTVFSEEPTA